MSPVYTFDKELEERIKTEDEDLATPEFLNLLRIAKAVYEHGANGFIPKEKLLDFVARMYDGGAQVRRIASGEEHGKITTHPYDVFSTAEYLRMHREYLSKPEKKD